MFNQKKSKLMQTKGQLMKSLNTAFSFAPPSILFLTILMSLLYHNDTIIKKEKELLRAFWGQFCKLEFDFVTMTFPSESRRGVIPAPYPDFQQR